jgi:hypothetical protein
MDSYAICILDDPWEIKPLIVNNIILGGYNNTNYGVRLRSISIPASLPLHCGIFNNAFHATYCDNYLTVATDQNTTGSVDSSTEVTPTPEYTTEFNLSEIQFLDRLAYNYRIDTSSPNPGSIQGNSSSFTSPSFLEQELEEAGGVTADLLTDIDGNPRDRYSIDRGAHEAYP